MARFQIGIVGYDVNPHTRCFDDFARNLAAALRALGHEVEYASPSGTGRLIMIGANNLSDDPASPKLPPDAIVYNTEQLAAISNPRVFMRNYEQYRSHAVWDYSSANVAVLKRLGIKQAMLCPLGYVGDEHSRHFRPARVRVPYVADVDKDIDVLFYGSMDAARREILDALDAAGLRVQRFTAKNAVYGAERDTFIARARVVLNLHYYKRGVFEIFRVSHLLENRKCVVTESGGCDTELEEFAMRSCVYVPREQIVDKCLLMVRDHVARQYFEWRGREEIGKIDFVENVRKALEASDG